MSLSMTASTPLQPFSSSQTTGIPPPPAQTTRTPRTRSLRKIFAGMISFGRGEGTTLLSLSPSGARAPSQFLRDAPGFLRLEQRADGFGWVLKGRILGIDLHPSKEGEDFPAGKPVGKLLLDEIPDHTLGFGAQNIQRVLEDVGVGCLLKGQKAYLGPVPVGEDHMVLPATSAMEAPAVRMFFRWTSAETGSPR